MAANFKILKKVAQVLSIALLALAFVGNSWAAEKINLKLSYPVPSKGMVGKNYEYFAKAVQEESQGQITIQTYPAASLISDRESLDAVREGNVDICHNMVAYATPTIKELTALEVPGAYLASDYGPIIEKIDPIVKKIYAKYGVRFLGSFGAGTLTWNATKKMIKVPEDLKGLAIRSYGKWLSEAVIAWGGTPTTVGLGDVPVALQRGTISALITAWFIGDSFKLQEQAPYISFLEMATPYQGLIMSEKAWARLDDQQKAAVDRAVKKWQNEAKNNLAASLANYKETLKKSGSNTYYLTKEENRAWLKVVDPMMEEVKKISGPEGQELIEALATLR